MKCLLLLLFSFISISASAQDSLKKISAKRATLPVKIDGILNEAAWLNAAVFDNMVEQRPNFKQPESYNSRTEALIMYDDNAVYVGGFNHEPTRDSISTELVGRDNIGVNDYFGVIFDTYLDQINGTGFFVTPLGEQFDVKYSLGNEDDSWSTVYETATNVTDSGWSFEIRIPYSALRFSKAQIQDWGINLIRRRTKTGEQFSWSPLDPNKFGLMSQSGRWTGIENIRSPLRLSFSPYFSSSIDYSPDSRGKMVKNTSINGGMDVKYGISKGFTLDMTLVPDFGQVQSDNLVLNLTPFEVRYNEYRPFFTEGTELFNKGNLFYSRRVGGAPVNSGLVNQELNKKSTIVNNPVETKLVNATKLSGRTSKGLGIGFFNAITKPQFTELLDSNKVQYEIETNPWTNYNIIVLDQTMKYNSSISLVNTNVLRSGNTYDANVTAGLFDIYDKNVDWNIWGRLANSRLTSGTMKTITGYNYQMNFGKFRGPLNFEIHHHIADNKYQQNDMGIFNNNNYNDIGGAVWYKINKPKGIYNRITFQGNWTYSMRFKPRQYQYLSINLNLNSQLKNLWNVGMFGNINPQQQDFYEPRTSGKKFKTPASWRTGIFFSTNQAKKYFASVDYSRRTASKYKAHVNDLFVSNNYRFNDKLNVGLSHFIGYSKNNAGFAYRDTSNSSNVHFGLRDRHTVENTLNIKYNFNIKMGLTFRTRHYWSKVNYVRFFQLNEDGYLDPLEASAVQLNPNNNVNFFNIDMIYTWQFAQGSFINLAWKNAGMLVDKAVNEDYKDNFTGILDTPHQNNLSVKIIYYLDYLDIRKNKVVKPAARNTGL